MVVSGLGLEQMQAIVEDGGDIGNNHHGQEQIIGKVLYSIQRRTHGTLAFPGGSLRMYR